MPSSFFHKRPWARGLRLAVVLSAMLCCAGAWAKEAEVRRFALVVGANDGGPSRAALRFSHTDARSVLKVLRQLGGVAPRDGLLLLEPDRFDLEAALGRLRGMLDQGRGSSARVELVFYYSGHSDEQGLMLGYDVVTYKELRSALQELPVEVRIAILDSCSSGALTRGKGGAMKPPFLLDASTDVRGYAYITSSAEDEVAQESDRIGGSFFTHFLLAGLRGAADQGGDGKITLSEAYQYAFHETLNRTANSQGGPQHPSYDFRLAGSGDLVLTDLRRSSARLKLPEELGGRVYLRDDRGQLFMELWKPAGAPMTLGVEPGSYQIFVDAKTEQLRGAIRVASSGTTLVSIDQLALAKRDVFAWRAKGGRSPDSVVMTDEGQALRHRPFSVGIVPGLTTDSASDSLVLNNISLNFVGWGDALRGFELGYIGNIRHLDTTGGQGAMVFNFTRGAMVGLQASGWFNRAGPSLMGFQGAGFVNSVGGPARGLQLAGLANSVQGSITGAQIVGGVNVAGGGRSRGLQLGALMNFGGGSFEGVQVAGMASASRGPVRGVQLSGAFNASAHGVVGGQMAAVNLAPDVRGVQFGVVNIARNVEGAQIGLVNIAVESARGPSLGLINYAGDGLLGPCVWTSDLALINVGLKMGTRTVYSLLGAGYQPLGATPSFSLFAGFGAHVDFHPAYLEVDYLLGTVHRNLRWSWEDPLLSHTVRLVFGWRVIDQMAILAGPTLGLEQSRDMGRASYIPEMYHQYIGGSRLSGSIGFVVGVSIEPRIGQLNRFE